MPLHCNTAKKHCHLIFLSFYLSEICQLNITHGLEFNDIIELLFEGVEIC